MATARGPAIPHAPELPRAERLRLLEVMVAARRRTAAVARERARRGMSPPLIEGWEAFHAAALRVLHEGDALVASAEWGAKPELVQAIGAYWRWTEPVGAGLGAALAGPSGSIVVVLAGPFWSGADTAALVTAVERRAPLLILFAAPGQAMEAAKAAAARAGAVLDPITEDVDVCLLAVDSAAASARAGKGPTVVACPPAPDHDPLQRYVARLAGIGIPRAELRAITRPHEEGA